MVNYLLQSDSVGQPFGVGIDSLLAYEDILTQVYDIHEIPLPTGNHGSVIVIDQGSLSKADIISAIEYCSRSQLKCLLLVGQGGLEHVDYLHLVDDFCVCPVEHSELKARLSRLAGDNLQQEDLSIIKVNDLYVDLSKYDVYVGNRKVALTYKEFQLLVSLAGNPGHVYTREDLLSRVWGYDYLGGTRTVDVHIRRLRSKIEDAEHVFVETIWNVGYKFNTEN